MKKLILYYCLLVLIGCKKDGPITEHTQSSAFMLNIPPGFPTPVMPEGNELTKDRVLLGKKLFFDPILSGNGKISCASCHIPSKAFSDTGRVSAGVEHRLGTRNTSPLFNLAYEKAFFWDAGAISLEVQALAPIENHLEMDMAVPALIEKLKKDSVYVALFKKAYDRPVGSYGLVRAISAFERTLISGNSRFDQYQFRNSSSALSASEKSGMAIFFSQKSGCANCHGGFNFTDFQLHNIGLYTKYEDIGRARVTSKESDVGSFKTPSLRNIEMTGPYMHDGSMRTLEEVVDFYSTGGKSHPAKDVLMKPISLTTTEKTDLINFLKSLTDHEFINSH